MNCKFIVELIIAENYIYICYIYESIIVDDFKWMDQDNIDGKQCNYVIQLLCFTSSLMKLY